MRVLIVNAFSDTPEGRKSFSDFDKLVREVISPQSFSYQKFTSLNQIEFLTADYASIDSFLHELNTPYLNPEAEKVHST